jgi:hypothetical protein
MREEQHQDQQHEAISLIYSIVLSFDIYILFSENTLILATHFLQRV